MTIELDRPHSPSVFEAGLPSVDYEQTQDPEEAHAILRHAREQAPIALGHTAPSCSPTNSSARRCAMSGSPRRRASSSPHRASPPGHCGTGGQQACCAWTATSTTGSADWCQRRSPPARPRDCAPRSRSHQRAGDRPDRRRQLRRRHRHCAEVPDPDHLRAARHDREDWELFSGWTDDIMKTFYWTAAQDEADILRSWAALDAYLDDMIARRRETLTDDLMSGLDPRRRRRRPLDARRTAHARRRAS